MEKKHGSLSTKFHVLSLLIIMLTFLGFGEGLSKIDQARGLLSLRRAKMHAKPISVNNEPWEEASTVGEEEMVSSFSDVGSMEDDLIAGGLPGQPSNVKFKQYAGYVDVDKMKGRSLFYYFAESAENSATKPLILWLNGGPGCSSLGMGAFVEVGPFGVNPDGKTLYSRRFAWNKGLERRRQVDECFGALEFEALVETGETVTPYQVQ